MAAHLETMKELGHTLGNEDGQEDEEGVEYYENTGGGNYGEDQQYQ